MSDDSIIDGASIAFSHDGKIMVQQVALRMEEGRAPIVTVNEGAQVVGRAPSEISPVYAVTWSPEVSLAHEVTVCADRQRNSKETAFLRMLFSGVLRW